jgi:hypothetical protein
VTHKVQGTVLNKVRALPRARALTRSALWVAVGLALLQSAASNIIKHGASGQYQDMGYLSHV